MSALQWMFLATYLGAGCLLFRLAWRAASSPKSRERRPQPVDDRFNDDRRRLRSFTLRSEMRADATRTRREFDRRLAEFKRRGGQFHG